jgi:hypothetical protein
MDPGTIKWFENSRSPPILTIPKHPNKSNGFCEILRLACPSEYNDDIKNRNNNNNSSNKSLFDH